MKYEIKNRFTGSVQFTAEIEADENTPRSVKIGLAIEWAVQNRADLSGADLSGANLSGADLFGADLSRADLSRAYLSRADLSDANLSDADLSRAYLSDANLSHANLSRANLSDANLSGAYLSRAYLSGVSGNMEEIKNLQIEQYAIVYTATHMRIGCKQHTIEDWRKMAQKRIIEMDGKKALTWWKKWKPVIFRIIEMSPAKGA